MRMASWLAGCTLSLAFGFNVASADVVTVSLLGHVTSVNDPTSGITVGQPITATYSYDSLTPPGAFQLFSPPASLSVAFGGQSLQMQSGWSYLICVIPAVGFEPAQLIYQSFSPSLPGQLWQSIAISFTDSSGQWPASAALPTTAPLVFSAHVSGQIFVTTAISSSFVAQVDSAALVPSLTISPASSSFLSQQSFDAVALLSAQIPVVSMQASVGGSPVPLSYPGTCQMASPNNAGRSALICPNASAALAGLGGGPVQIDWQVVLGDGSTVQQSVVWNLVQ